MASITITPTSGNVVSTQSACRVEVADADQNTTTGYTTAVYPTSPEMRYYLTFELGGETLGRSYVFGVNEDGDHTFNNYIFPEAGSWTIRLSNASNDASVATASVTVS